MSHKCFTNKECPYFPCHAETEGTDFNCMFCFCPLYALGDQCGGNFRYTANGVKDCTYCNLPHQGEKGWEHVMNHIGAVIQRTRKPATPHDDNGKQIC